MSGNSEIVQAVHKREKKLQNGRRKKRKFSLKPQNSHHFLLRFEEQDVANDPVVEEDDNRTNTQVAISVVEPESIIGEIPTSTKIDGFGNDIGLWPDMPTHDMIAFWANKGSSSL